MSAFNLPWGPDETNYLRVWIVSVTISAMVYGAVLSVALSYIPLLLKTSNDISRRMRNFLLLYVVFMVTISTIYNITMVIALTKNLFIPFDLGRTSYVVQNGFLGGLCVILASWGADGFMLWRCAMLYQGISRPRGIALVILLVCLGCMSFVGGLTFLCIKIFSALAFTVVLTSITILLNLVTATLITLRIIYLRKFVRKAVGLGSNSPYTMFLVICLESSALIIVFSALFLSMSTVPNGAAFSYMIPMQLLVHVYVLSPLLIIYRVARGKSVVATSKPSESGVVVSVLHLESTATSEK